MEVEELLEKLDGSRVRVVYDSPYAIRSFIFGHLMNESCCCVVYSDTMMRRLERTYSSLRRAGYPELNVRVVCIGSGKHAFGRLERRISPEKPAKHILAEMLSCLRKETSENSRILLFGFYLMKLLYSGVCVEYMKFLEKLECENYTLFDFWPADFCTGIEDHALRRAYDVVLEVKSCPEQFYGEDVYSISVADSVLFDVPPSQNFYRLSGFRFTPYNP